MATRRADINTCDPNISAPKNEESGPYSDLLSSPCTPCLLHFASLRNRMHMKGNKKEIMNEEHGEVARVWNANAGIPGTALQRGAFDTMLLSRPM